jgi:hypothetical protein
MPACLGLVLDHDVVLDHNYLVENVVFDDHNVLVQDVVCDDHFELSYAFLEHAGCRSWAVRRTRVRAARLPLRLRLRHHQPVLQPMFAGRALGDLHDHDQEHVDDEFVRHTVGDPVSGLQQSLGESSTTLGYTFPHSDPRVVVFFTCAERIRWLHAVHRQLRRSHPPGRPNLPGGRSRQLPGDPEIAVLARSDVHQTGSRVDPERLQRQL